jgi:MBG domain-containing protein/beta-propeller repeat-containing protein
MLNERVVPACSARVSIFVPRNHSLLSKLSSKSWLRVAIGPFAVITCLLVATFRAHPAVAQENPSGKKAAVTLSKQSQTRILASYGQLPLSFEVNHGQTDGRVKFLSRGRGYGLFLTPTSAVLVLHKVGTPVHAMKTPTEPLLQPAILQIKGSQVKAAGSEELSYSTLRINLMGANAVTQAEGLAQLPGKSNYFIGNDPKQWRVNVPTYAKVKFRDVYSGVDLVYYGNQQQLEHDFVVAPGADPASITMGFQGATRVCVDDHGDLRVSTGQDEVVLKKPVVYQESGTGRSEIAGKYVLKGKKRVGFEVARYDSARPLVIDPILVYASYLGGSSEDRPVAIAVDSAGSAYVTGWTSSANFPLTSGSFQAALVGACRPGCSFNQDAFVSKVSPDGSTLIYSTYLGGHGSGDTPFGIAVDSTGSAYVAGITTAPDFPTTPGAFQAGPRGPYYHSGFVTKLDTMGSALVYSTYLGGSSGADNVAAIAIDSAGAAYVTGNTGSQDFPTTPGALQTSPGVSGGPFVTKLDPIGSTLIYSTFLSDNNNDGPLGIAVDAAGSAYVTGLTTRANFPTTPGAFQTSLRGSVNAFVAKLNAAGSAFVYSTYLGGSRSDNGLGIAVDLAGSAYVTGVTYSADFPVTPGAFQSAINGTTINGLGVQSDAFVTKLNADGSGLVYSTYLGGSQHDSAQAIALDSAGSAYVIGSTTSTDFPLTAGPVTSACFSPADGGTTCESVFVSKLNTTGSALEFSTYFGHNDIGSGIAVDSAFSAYVTGRASTPPGIPITSGAFQPQFRGGNEDLGLDDGFVAKIAEGTPSPAAIPLTITAHDTSRQYGSADPIFLASYSGFTNGDGVQALSGSLVCSSNTTAASPVGTYPITCSGLSSQKYAITYQAGVLTITPAPLTVTANNASRLYGGSNPAFTGTVAGVQNGDNISATYSTSATSISPAGTYLITPALVDPTGKLGNYSVTVVNGTLTVIPAPLTITANNGTSILHGALPSLTPNYSGFVNGDGPSSLSGALNCTTNATAASPVGGYLINCSGQISNNYSIGYKSGTLSIIYQPGGACDGAVGHAILPPINANGTSVYNQGRRVPAQFRVCDANGVSIGTPGVVTGFYLTQISSGTSSSSVDEAVASTTPDTAFRWDSTGQRWIFHISTTNLPAGQTYGFTIGLNDGSKITFGFGLK